MLRLERPPWGRLALVSTALFTATLLFVPAAQASSRGRSVLDLGVGTSIPFSEDLREDYGAAAGIMLGFARKLPGDGAHLTAEIELWGNSGQEFPIDPTFEVPDAEYSVVAFNFGFRRNMIPEQKRQGLDVFFGLGVHWAFTTWTSPFDESFTTPTLGVFFEFRPELELSRSWSAWLRARTTIMLDAQYPRTSVEQNYSGQALQIGVCRYFGGGAS